MERHINLRVFGTLLGLVSVSACVCLYVSECICVSAWTHALLTYPRAQLPLSDVT